LGNTYSNCVISENVSASEILGPIDELTSLKKSRQKRIKLYSI